MYERHHATLFVDPQLAEPLERLRRRFDPEAARQIAAHVTLVYPWEASTSSSIADWVRDAAVGFEPFRLRLGTCELDDPEAGGGCGFSVVDVDGGHAGLRARIEAPGFSPGQVAPHVTIVHPRTSNRGTEAWQACRSMRLDIEFWVREVAITAWDGNAWPAVETMSLHQLSA